MDHVARAAFHRQRFAGQRRLVAPEKVAVEQLDIRRHDVAQAYAHDVAGDPRDGVELAPLAVSLASRDSRASGELVAASAPGSGATEARAAEAAVMVAWTPGTRSRGFDADSVSRAARHGR